MHVLSLSGIPGRTAISGGDEYLYFSGYAYLGMQHVPGYDKLVREGLDRYGWLFPSSRISNTRLELYGEAESLLSSITGSEETVLVSSGYTAGRMAISKWEEQIINLEPSHPAIRPSTPRRSRDATVFAVDSVNPLTATITDFSFETKNKSRRTVIVDDSHGIGLLGANGEGISAFLPRDMLTEYVLTYSLSKAFNLHAGAIGCSRSIAAELRAMPAYAASTAPSPALLYAFTKGLHLYAQQRVRLNHNIEYFRSVVSNWPEIKSHPSLPVFVLPASVDEAWLLEQKIIISSFPYPDPHGEKIQRVVLNALHTKEDLDILAEHLSKLLA